jgi:hypothetical protein
MQVLVYPGRNVHDVLPQFAGTNVIKPTAERRAELGLSGPVEARCDDATVAEDALRDCLDRQGVAMPSHRIAH